MNQVVASRLKRPDCGAGCILDGYPRTLGQAKFLDGLLEDFGWGEPTVCDFDISGEQVVARLGRRRQCPSCSRIFSLDEHSGRVKLICDRDGALLIRREDDNPKVIRERMRLYAENANEIVPYYARRQYYRISAARPASDILQDVLDIVRCGSLQRVNGNQTRAASQTIAAF